MRDYDDSEGYEGVKSTDDLYTFGNAADATPDSERLSSDPYYATPHLDHVDSDIATTDENPENWND